ncbi:MAG: NHLP bacteriocin export ABC transporter permease/ATPase subunit [Clostridiales Family XIII bacterium]|jgi:ATP-binding cassette subfamily C protein|nr:NHLP bacteriocin export ABC transporter permease/ATPase subunit [Clostridiales Family XIII bacterium]
MKKNDVDKLNLRGGEMHITDDSNQSFVVEDGSVLVYILPYRDEKIGRRFLLHEAMKGEAIPSLCVNDSTLGIWRFGFVALDQATMTIQNSSTSELKSDFAQRANIHLFDILDFEEQMIEQYEINIIKEEGNIYATGQEQKAVYERGLHSIFDLFARKRKRKTPESGNKIYDTVATICDYMNIPIATFDSIRESSGRRFTVNDIARVSHFICRDVVFDENWYKMDTGPVIAYTREGKIPVACIPKGPNRYDAIDPKTGASIPVTRAYAQTLNMTGIMLYRPFPAKIIKLKELVRFGIQSVYKRDFVTFIALALLGTLIGLLLPMMNEQLYDNFIPMGNTSGLTSICAVVLACVIGNMTFTVVKNLATFRSMNSMEYTVQSAMYDRLFNLPESFFRRYDSADLAMRAMGLSSIYNLMADVIVKSVLAAFFSLLYLWRMIAYSGKLAAVSSIMLVVSMLIIGLIGWRQTRLENSKIEVDSKVGSVMYQLLSGISKIRIAGVENRALYEYLKPYSESKSINIKKERMSVVVNTIHISMNTLFNLVLFYMMIKNKMDLSMGAFMGFSTAFGSFSAAMLEIISNLLTVNEAFPTYKRAKPILEELPEYDDDTQLPGDLTGDIEVSNVSFGYDEQSGIVLHDLNCHIKSGEYIGIVGSSGCGKSTLLKLLLGFEKPSAGKIFYDGMDVDGIDKRELRKKFGVVLQDGKLISGSIYENITITSPGVTGKRVNEVIEEVGIKEDIDQMPMGLHTVLSEDSGTISGGQQQRILIARAIVGKPKILYFDEATSALDNVTQAMVTESLEQLHATKVVIAHRLSTVMNCDRILVMDKGHIIEEGNYTTLMAQKGQFYELASRQMA